MPLSARILAHTVFQCPKEGCFCYFTCVEATFTHVCKVHPTFGGSGGDMAIEEAIVPTTIYHDDLSNTHLCQKCSQLLPSIDFAEAHLRSTDIHQAQVIRFHAAEGLHKILPTVTIQDEEPNVDCPPIRIIFQQRNWIYGDNRIVVRSSSCYTPFINHTDSVHRISSMKVDLKPLEPTAAMPASRYLIPTKRMLSPSGPASRRFIQWSYTNNLITYMEIVP